MSKKEVAKFKKLLNDWHDADAKTASKKAAALLDFMAMYRFPIVSALEFAAR